MGVVVCVGYKDSGHSPTEVGEDMQIARALVTRPLTWERKFLYPYKQVARRVVTLNTSDTLEA
jgi:hypothetical protein